MTKYYLSFEERSQCWEAARFRQAESERLKLNDSRQPIPLWLEAKSYMAELVATKYLNISPQTGVNQFAADIVYSGIQIDVKTSKGGPWMSIPTGSLYSNWCYFFVTGDESTGEFSMVGWISGSNVIPNSNLTDWRKPEKGMVYAVPQKNLRPFKNNE